MPQLLVQISHLSKSFGHFSLFEDICFSIHAGEVFALIGENGAGKTTFLKLLTGDLSPDRGEIIRGDSFSIGTLPQEIVLKDPSISMGLFLENRILSDIEKEMQGCLEASNLEQWQELHARYEQLGGYRRLPLQHVLQGLKLECICLNTPMSSLSSGQRVRAALAKALMENPDLLILDEPTNHLDREMVAWLEETLKQRVGASIIVSHDRCFLNAVCNQLVEINQGKLARYGGNYDFYLAQQERILERKLKAYEAQEEEIAALKQSIKALTFSKAKAAPPKDRNIMAYDKRGEKHQKSLQHKLETFKIRLKELELNPLLHPKPKSIKGLHFMTMPLASLAALEVEGISKSYGSRHLFTQFSKTLYVGDRIALIGPNGAGKTTLMKILYGKLSADSGLLRKAPTARISYLDQEVAELPMHKTVLEYFEERFHLSEELLRRELHKAALGGGELLYRRFSTLSTGQRKRMMLLVLVLEKPNILLLDEPTNHLDFLTLEALEKALLEFEGAILAISHDRTFIKKIANQEWHLS